MCIKCLTKYLESLPTKFVTLNKQPCQVIPTFIDLYLNEPLYCICMQRKKLCNCYSIFSLFFLLVVFSSQAVKNFLPMSYLSLLTTHVAKSGLFSLYTQASVSIYFLLVVSLDASSQYIFNCLSCSTVETVVPET